MPDLWISGIIFSLKKDAPALLSLLKRKAGKPSPADLSWIDALPNGNPAAALQIILEKLRALVDSDAPSSAGQTSTLYMIGKRCHPYVAALEHQYVNVQKLPPQVDDLIWESVREYYRILTKGFLACLDHHQRDPEHSTLTPQHLAIIIAQTMDAACNQARWNAMRHQLMPVGGWLRIHKLYALAEGLGCTHLLLKLYSGTDTTIDARYARALMLSTINFTGMQKWEIARVDEWLTLWMKSSALTRRYDAQRHLFYVNLEEDHGARRIRHFQPTDACRYWETDPIAQGIPYFRQLLQKNASNPASTKMSPQELASCLTLLDHLYAEWSREGYRRQRRNEQRHKTSKLAYVAHGLLDVYHMVKDIEMSRQHRNGYTPDGRTFEERLSRHSPLRGGAPSIAMPWLSGVRWTIQDQSPNGFGARVDESQASELRIGRLVAAVFDDHKDRIQLGVVRSIRSISAKEYQVGVEVISHAVAPIMLSALSSNGWKGNGLAGNQPHDPYSALETIAPALVLMEEAERGNQPASLMMPVVNHIQGASMNVTHLNRSNTTIRLGEVIEQKDDWVRVGFST